MHAPIEGHRLFFIDIETTGLKNKYYNPSLIEIAAVDGLTNNKFR